MNTRSLEDLSVQAIIETGGKQYRVAPGKRLEVERLPTPETGPLVFDKVLALIDDAGKLSLGTPYLEKARVEAKHVGDLRGDKIVIGKYKRRKKYRRKQGHRQELTAIEVTAIKQ